MICQLAKVQKSINIVRIIFTTSAYFCLLFCLLNTKKWGKIIKISNRLSLVQSILLKNTEEAALVQLPTALTTCNLIRKPQPTSTGIHKLQPYTSTGIRKLYSPTPVLVFTNYSPTPVLVFTNYSPTPVPYCGKLVTTLPYTSLLDYIRAMVGIVYSK